MKVLKYILGIIVVAVLGFLSLGFITSEIEYENNVLVNKPITECWQVSQDPSKMKDWLEGFQKFEHVSGPEGQVGGVSKVYFINEGQEMMIQETITNIVKNESISMLFESDFMNMDYTLMMKTENGKTKISSKTKTVGNNMFFKSIMALMGENLKTQEDTNLGNLKKTIEQNSKTY
ncbi:MAG: SRPBCC family protein [Flavobacteriales bacterium]